MSKGERPKARCEASQKISKRNEKKCLTKSLPYDILKPSKGRKTHQTRKDVCHMKKMTYIDALNVAIELTEGEVQEKLIALRDATAKRNSADRKPTKTQEANEAIKTEILAFLADGELHTVSEIMCGVASLEDASNQKASALVRQLVEAGAVIREEVKRKAYFRLA
jgi:hypothetical protein